MSQPPVEVLVHIGAPSKASDDARYRYLAQAYLDFEPASRQLISPKDDDRGQVPQPLEGGTAVADSIDLSNLSFQSVWENTDSPGLHKKTLAQPRSSQATLPAWHPVHYVSPTAVIPDSQPVEPPRKQPSARPGLRKTFSSLSISTVSNSQESFHVVPDPEEENPDLSVLKKTPRKRLASPSPSFIGRLPLAKRLSMAAKSQPAERAVEAGGARQSQDMESTQSFASSAATEHDDDQQQQQLSQDNVPSSQPEECGKVVHLNESFLKFRSPERFVVTESAAVSPIKLRLEKKISREEPAPTPEPPQLPPSSPVEPHHVSLRILPPEPSRSHRHLDASSLVTDKLAKLARDLDLKKRYRPSEPPVRRLRPFERGFWQVHTQDWPVAVRHRAWSFLAGYVGRGDAGWGVWCSRDAAPHTYLRLHCFGAVVGHTYLLLYLASQRHILDTGAEWLDATCTPTIVVKAKRQGTGHESLERRLD